MLALFAATTAFALLQIKSIDRDTTSALDAYAEIGNRAVDMRKAIDDIYLNSLLAVLVLDPQDLTYYKGQIESSHARYVATKTELLERSHGGSDIPGLAEILKTVTQAEQVFPELQQAIARRVAAAESLEEFDQLKYDEILVSNMFHSVKKNVDIWFEAVNGAVVTTVSWAQARKTRVAVNAQLAMTVQVAASVAAILIGMLAAWAIARGVSRPIQDSVKVAERIAGGQLATPIARGGAMRPARCCTRSRACSPACTSWSARSATVPRPLS